MKCDEMKRHHINDVMDMHNLTRGKMGYSVVYYADDVDAAIAELKQKLEDVQASHYAEMVDAGMRERRLRRALWLARAQRANEHYHRYHGKFLCPLEDIPEYVKWTQVERKCRAKAEGYK